MGKRLVFACPNIHCAMMRALAMDNRIQTVDANITHNGNAGRSLKESRWKHSASWNHNCDIKQLDGQLFSAQRAMERRKKKRESRCLRGERCAFMEFQFHSPRIIWRYNSMEFDEYAVSLNFYQNIVQKKPWNRWKYAISSIRMTNETRILSMNSFENAASWLCSYFLYITRIYYVPSMDFHQFLVLRFTRDTLSRTLVTTTQRFVVFIVIYIYAVHCADRH